VQRPTVAIVSDKTDFSRTVSARWQMERNSPSFLLSSGASSCQLESGTFDLAVIGGLEEPVGPVLAVLRRSRKPAIYVSRLNGHSAKFPGVCRIPEIDGWPEVLVMVAQQILERERTSVELSKLTETKSQLEREASLGRYLLEMRHNLNNALTSILGNSELILLDPDSLSPNLKLQIETIRNMGMRMNEIMQRFSSLQKEMQLVEQQRGKKAARASAGV
jgi:signal transduction histidine kinase